MLAKRFFASERHLPDKDHEACGLFGVMDISGKRFGGEMAINAIKNIKVRGNGLGGGFAVYGLYPDYKDYYALQIMFQNKNATAKEKVEDFLVEHFNIVYDEEIPTNPGVNVFCPPLVWRYFVAPKKKGEDHGMSDDDYVVSRVMDINTSIEDAYVFSSGKDMGVFKGVGFPEEIAAYFLLDELYEGYLWTVHSRFPTNTPGWWGGAHPFTLLDWSIVHNGEISSYDANARFLEMFGYKCTLQTDTEVITYIFDYLMRKQGLSIELAVATVAAPLWKEIDRMEEGQKETIKALRTVFGSLLVNGPFSIILGTRNGIVALNDRIKLRNMVAATKGDFLYVASEESGIREICPDPEEVWVPKGGEPVIGLLEGVEHI